MIPRRASEQRKGTPSLSAIKRVPGIACDLQGMRFTRPSDCAKVLQAKGFSAVHRIP